MDEIAAITTTNSTETHVSAAAMNEMLPITNSATLDFSSPWLGTKASCPSGSVLAKALMPSMWYWVRATFRRIIGDSTFGVTFQDEALVDLIDKHTKDRRSATFTVTDGSEEPESDCDDGSNYDESDNDAEDEDDWVCAPRHPKNRNTTSHLFPQELLKFLSE
jgi:hypothetical protein